MDWTGILPIDLSANWRVADDPLQWLLQRRRNNDWLSRRFPTDRKTLLRDIRELCGEVSPDIQAAVEALPERHPGFVAHHDENMAQYYRENPSAGRANKTGARSRKGLADSPEGAGVTKAA